MQAFVEEAASAGIDVFRVFDSLNWAPNMRVAMEAVQKSGAICEAAICYTGDVLDKKRTKYNLKYYVALAKELEKMGAHILAIKDMAGLCKPYAAELLVRTLKQEIGIPIHFHTHDTSGVQAAAILKGAEVDLDIADAAFSPLSGLTSQPNLNSVVEALRFTPRDTGLNPERLERTAEYWEAARDFYASFETGMKASTASVYHNEMPGGQYTNLFEQAKAIGLGSRWYDICRMYADVNQLFGDIVKVTPSSKAVGDMALYLIANNLTVDDVLDFNRELTLPGIGCRPGLRPHGAAARRFSAQGARANPARREAAHRAAGRPVCLRPTFSATAKELEPRLGRQPTRREIVSHIIYPRVVSDFITHQETYGDTSVLPTPVFFYGPQTNEELAVEIEPGKTLIIKFLTIGDPHPDGTRTVFFELNGQPRDVTVTDTSLDAAIERRPKAETGDPNQVGAPCPA